LITDLLRAKVIARDSGCASRKAGLSDQPRDMEWPARQDDVTAQNAALDGAATAQERVLRRRCISFNSGKLRYFTALTALGR
jgi:hypothetical protein